MGVPIVSGATAVQLPDGNIIILVINQALWMADTMDHTLLNPNQMRYDGTTVQDNPFDDRGMYLQRDNNCHIPLTAMGTIIGCDSWAPTDHELQYWPHVQLTSDSTWDPSNVDFSISTKIGMTRTSILRYRDDELAQYIGISDVTTAEDAYKVPEDVPGLRTFQSKERHNQVSAEQLSEKWHIGLGQAQQTILVTTQKGVRSALLPMARRYRTDRMFQHRRLQQRFFTDTFFAKHKSLDQNTCAQLFANESFFPAVYPMRSKAMAGQALGEFISDFGIPNQLIMDGASEQCKPNTEFMQKVKKYEIDHRLIEPERHNQNRAEAVIRELKKKWFRVMTRRLVPKRLWDYGIRWVADVMQRSVNSVRALKGRTPIEEVTGETPDISEYLDFGFYDYVWYWENAGLGERQLGRWLGASHRVGSQMCYYVIKQNGQVISRTSVQCVTNLELQTDEVKALVKQVDDGIQDRLKDDRHEVVEGAKEQPIDWRGFDLSTDEDFIAEFQKVVDSEHIPEVDTGMNEYEPDAGHDNYINIEIALPTETHNDPQLGKVTKRRKGMDGKPLGIPHDNPLLDTRQYDVEFQDGSIRAFTANQIAENMFAQVDEHGRRYILMNEIIDHRKNADAVPIQDAFLTDKAGRKHQRKTTKGWELLVSWKDGTSNWIKLKDVKEDFPVQTAEYAHANKISMEPAFVWWVPHVLTHRKRIIAKVKTKYWQRTHRFGIRIPKTVSEAIKIDKENNNTYWRDAITQEMKNIRQGFRVWDDDTAKIPKNYQQIKCHIIFDVKPAENFRRKARFVADGNRTDVPPVLTYSSVVSRDSVRIALLMAALNGLDIASCDIQNAYLTADCREKIWFIAGPEFGDEAGLAMIVEKALYGLKTSGAAFRSLLANTLYDSGFRPTRGDPDVHIRAAVRPDGKEYYEMMLCYVDDVMCVSHRAQEVLKEVVQTQFKLKNNAIAPPQMYLGAQLSERDISGCKCWTITSTKYVESIVKNLETRLKEEGKQLPTRCDTPIRSGYRPEIDATEELVGDQITMYQELIGELRWAVELGRIDLNLEVSLMSSYLANPREGHLEQVIHIFGYLKKVPKKSIAMDPRSPAIDQSRFVKHDWEDFYRDAREPIPEDLPSPRGCPVSIHCFVDASHADNRANRRSQTGILLFVNRAPILYYSKRQNTVESSTFGSEFVALKTATEMIQGLRFKLRTFGIPIDGPADVYCDNEAVTKASANPNVTLAKKHNAVAFHKCREAVAMQMIRVAYEPTRTNLSDLLTKLKSRGERERLIDFFMY